MSKGSPIEKEDANPNSKENPSSKEIEMPKKLKMYKSDLNSEDFTHRHPLTHVEPLNDNGAMYECMECMVRFGNSDKLLQHIDNHKYLNKEKKEKDNTGAEVQAEIVNELECPMCPFKPKDSLTPEESRNAIRKHTILEHFKAKIPPSLIKGPSEYKYENNIDESSKVLDIAPKYFGDLKCSICPRSFDKPYQVRVHERYAHQKMAEDIAQIKKLIKCESCKLFCKDKIQYKLHKELYCGVGFQCKQCSERFAKISQLATHLKLAHSAKSNGKTREILIHENKTQGSIEVK